MRRLKQFALIIMCLSLLSGNMASASMLCCKKTDDTVNMQKDSKMNCHKLQDSKKSSSAKHCNDCKSCVNNNVISVYKGYEAIIVSAINHLFPNNLFMSVIPSGIENPPKQIS